MIELRYLVKKRVGGKVPQEIKVLQYRESVYQEVMIDGKQVITEMNWQDVPEEYEDG